MTSIVRQFCAIVFATLLAGAAVAEWGATEVSSDLNGDGYSETFTLIDTGEGTVNLQITGTGGPWIIANNIAWKGGPGQEPMLELAPNGSVRLISMNEAIGRNRWFQTLTIAYRNGAYRVAGFTYSWYDTLNLEDTGECDLNLLNGRGFLTVNEVKRSVRTTQSALPVTDWTDVTPIPDVCGLNDY